MRLKEPPENYESEIGWKSDGNGTAWKRNV